MAIKSRRTASLISPYENQFVQKSVLWRPVRRDHFAIANNSMVDLCHPMNSHQMNVEKFGCLKRITWKTIVEKSFSLENVPSNILTSVFHKIPSLDRLNTRMSCKYLNKHVEKIKKDLVRRPDRRFGLSCETKSSSQIAIHLVERRLVYDNDSFKTKSVSLVVPNIDHLYGFSFDFVKIIHNGDDTELETLLFTLDKLRVGVNYIDFIDVPEIFITRFLKIVKSKEIRISGKILLEQFYKSLAIKKIDKVVINDIISSVNPFLELYKSCKDIHLLYTSVDGGKLNRTILETLCYSSCSYFLSHIKMEFKEVCCQPILSSFSKNTLFSSDCLDEEYVFTGKAGDMYQFQQAFPNRIDLLHNEMGKEILAVERIILRKKNKEFEYFILEDKEEMIHVLFDALAGVNWPLDFSTLYEELFVGYDGYQEIITQFVKQYYC